MQRQAAFPITGGVLCLIAATVAVGAQPGPVAPPAGPALAPRTHGFMLYLSQPMGGGGGAALHPKFGFRIDQVRMMGNSGAPDAGDPMQRRSLVGWQMGGGGLHASDVKLELGGRLTYDVTHGGFGIQTSRPGMASAPSHPTMTAASNRTTASGFAGASEPRSFELHGLAFHGADVHGSEDNARPFTRELFHEANESSSALHEMAAAAIATFKSSHTAPMQQRSRPSERPFSMQETR